MPDGTRSYGQGYSDERTSCWASSGDSLVHTMVASFELLSCDTLQVGNTWRTTDDIQDNYNSMLANLDNTIGLAQFAGPGTWNDPDLLEVPHSLLASTHLFDWPLAECL